VNNKEALEYLYSRGIKDETIIKFQIGLFPQDLRELFDIIEPQALREAGLIKNASKSIFKTWDLVVPIKDAYDNCIALTGRLRMSEKEREDKNIPKYINSVYKKSQHLFGLNFAKHDILKSGVAYAVEGIFDVITPHQSGLSNIVGVCGKYLSTRQIALLSRYADRIVLILDNEEEAQQCARKIIERKQYDGVSLIAKNPFPDGIKDMDQFLRERSVEELLSVLEEKISYEYIKPLW
jgi:DNA primase